MIRNRVSYPEWGIVFVLVLLAALVVGVPRSSPAVGAQAVAAKKTAAGTLRVVLSGTGTYTVTRKGYRKSASATRTFRVRPGTYRIKAAGATVTPAKARVRAGKRTTVRVSFPVPQQRPTPPPTPTPTPPPSPPPAPRYDTLALGEQHSCGIDTLGRTWCWGSNSSGQLGDGGDRRDEFSPVQVTGGHVFTRVAAGTTTTCALDAAGKAWCWGSDNNGKLGDGNDDQGDEFAPVAVVGDHVFTMISVGVYRSCGIDITGAAWCWGYDGSGGLGNGDDAGNDQPAPVAVVGGHSFSSVSVGRHHTCGIDTAGAAWCWGTDALGQLGDGSDDQADHTSPVAVSGGGTYSMIAAADTNTCALDTAQRAWCWGADSRGQLGDGAPTDTRYSPGQVVGGHTFTTLSIAGLGVCAIDTGRQAWCWGWDIYGQLGDGDDDEANEPEPVAVVGDHAFTRIDIDTFHSCAIDAGGQGWCWGYDDSGELGNGNDGQVGKSAPVAVSGGMLFAQ